MKKSVKRIALIAVLAVMVVSVAVFLVACSSTVADGEYKFEKVEITTNGKTETILAADADSNMMAVTYKAMTITVEGNKMTTMGVTTEFKLDGDNQIVGVDGTETGSYYEGGKLVMKAEMLGSSMTIYFAR